MNEMSTSNFSTLASSQLKEWNIVKLILASCALVLILSLTFHIIYTIYFHPLARFPGPFLWKLTRFPYMRAMQRGTLVHEIQKFHTQYGEIIRIARDELSCINPQAWQDIYGNHKPAEMFQKNSLWMSRQKNSAHSILSAKDQDHRRIRKLISPAFSEKALREQEPVLQQYIGALMKRLHDQVQAGWGNCADVNLVDWFSWVTFDIVGELGFNETFGCLSSPNHHHWSNMVFSHFKAASLVTSVKFYPFLERILRSFLPAEVLNRSTHFQLSQEKVHRRLKNNADATRTVKDFMSYVLDPTLEERMSMEEIETTFNILIIAGSETTASALAGTTGYLLRNPTCLATLVKEIRGSFGQEQDITLAAVSKLPYLAAVIEEGLRMAPPVPSGLPRVVPAAGATVCGEWIPGGTNISLNQYTAYRSPLNFYRPHDFLPERWLLSTKASSLFQYDRKDALQPFSYGRRDCIGKSLAYAELKLILSRMLWSFDIEFSPTGRANSGVGKQSKEKYEWESQKTFVLVEKKPLIVRIKTVCR